MLVELDDIIDLPARAEMVEALLADDARLVAAFEGLTVLEGTGGNVKEAWRRNARAGRADLGELMQYLRQVRSFVFVGAVGMEGLCALLCTQQHNSLPPPTTKQKNNTKKNPKKTIIGQRRDGRV